MHASELPAEVVHETIATAERDPFITANYIGTYHVFNESKPSSLYRDCRDCFAQLSQQWRVVNRFFLRRSKRLVGSLGACKGWWRVIWTDESPEEKVTGVEFGE